MGSYLSSQAVAYSMRPGFELRNDPSALRCLFSIGTDARGAKKYHKTTENGIFDDRFPESWFLLRKDTFWQNEQKPEEKKTGESGAWLDKFGQSERQTYVWHPLGWSRSLRKSSDPVLAVLKPWDWENPSGHFTKR